MTKSVPNGYLSPNPQGSYYTQNFIKVYVQRVVIQVKALAGESGIAV